MTEIADVESKSTDIFSVEEEETDVLLKTEDVTDLHNVLVDSPVFCIDD